MVQKKCNLTGVAETFQRHFDDGLEVGAGLAVFVEGELAVNLWDGFADKARTQPWQADTLVNVWSTSKNLMALAIAMEVDRGHLSYTDPVARHWPEFAQAGKEAITVEQVLSHQAGMNAFRAEMEADDVLDWELSTSRLAAQQPWWEPGTDQGYGALTYGFMAGEILHRVTGKMPGLYVRDEITRPLGIADQLYLGLPDAEQHRAAEMIKPKGVPRSGDGTPPGKDAIQAFRNPPIDANRPNDPAYRAAQIPSTNVQATAFGFARLFSELAQGGGVLLSPETLAEATRVRTERRDRTLRQPMRWAAGFLRNDGTIYGPGARTFGHSGFGGSFAFADPDASVSVGYVMNRMDINLFADPRSKNLIGSIFEALGQAA